MICEFFRSTGSYDGVQRLDYRTTMSKISMYDGSSNISQPVIHSSVKILQKKPFDMEDNGFISD